MSHSAERIERDIKRVYKTLNALPDRTVVELVRRAGKRETPLKSSDRVNVARGSNNDPTGNAVANRLEVKERTKEAQIASCEACDREVANSASDRLRSGYCPKDYMAWLRTGTPYRFRFEIEVRSEK